MVIAHEPVLRGRDFPLSEAASHHFRFLPGQVFVYWLDRMENATFATFLSRLGAYDRDFTGTKYSVFGCELPFEYNGWVEFVVAPFDSRRHAVELEIIYTVLLSPRPNIEANISVGTARHERLV